MEKLPKNYILLKELKTKIDEYFVKCNTNTIARSTDIYDYVYNKAPFKSEFKSAREFNHFLRVSYDSGILTHFIPNCTVDTSIFTHYQWRFFPLEKQLKNHSSPEDKNLATSHESINSIFSNNKLYTASNGTKVRSKQELLIINKLLSEETLDIYYERPLKVERNTKYPDFTIVNKNTKTVFHWEHFGMINSSNYADKMTEKVQWYKGKGYRFIDEGGTLIITYFENEIKFANRVDSIIEIILSR